MPEQFGIRRVSVMVPAEEHRMLVEYQKLKGAGNKDTAIAAMIREVAAANGIT